LQIPENLGLKELLAAMWFDLSSGGGIIKNHFPYMLTNTKDAFFFFFLVFASGGLVFLLNYVKCSSTTAVVTTTEGTNSTTSVNNSNSSQTFTTEINGVEVIMVSAIPTNDAVSNLTEELFVAPNNSSSFNLGALIPLTLDGNVVITDGVLLAESFKCSIAFINNNKGIIPNTYLTYTIQDTTLDINVAINQAILLERQNTFAVIGPQPDNQVIPAINLYQPFNIPLMSYAGGDSLLSNSTTYPTYFRTWPNDGAQARAMAETFRLLGWTFISALFTNDQYGVSGKNAFQQAASRQRIRMTCLNVITPNATQGLQNFAQCLQTSDANVVLLWMGPQDAANSISVLYNITQNSRLTFAASDRWALTTNITRFTQMSLPFTGLTFPPSYLQGILLFNYSFNRSIGILSEDR
jgi:hypothetical protein